jgi:hypothetical protein
VADLDTPFPTLQLDAEPAWAWPQPPFARRDVLAPLGDAVEPCRIETPSGATVEGHLTHFDIDAQALRFRSGAAGEPLALSFARFSRLTLTTPRPLIQRAKNAPIERVPTAAQERGYRVELKAGGQLSGRTLGHVNQQSGWFLFAPQEDGETLLRVFVPRAAVAEIGFDKSAEEQAVERWIATPAQLLAALEAQQRTRIRPLGEALIDLGLVTRGMLDRVASRQGIDRDVPLGEMLVNEGLIDRDDLQTALALKMGYPLVDLSRFPIDPQAARQLSHRVLLEHRVVPLMRRGDWLVVAVDDLARIPRLQALQALAALKVVPVLAARARIAVALAALPQRLGTDCWADNVPLQQRAWAAEAGAPPVH